MFRLCKVVKGTRVLATDCHLVCTCTSFLVIVTEQIIQQIIILFVFIIIRKAVICTLTLLQ